MLFKRSLVLMLISLLAGLVFGWVATQREDTRQQPSWDVGPWLSPEPKPFSGNIPYKIVRERSPIEGERHSYTSLYLGGKHCFGVDSQVIELKGMGKVYRLAPGNHGTMRLDNNVIVDIKFGHRK
jgi:hypothetical protein